MHIDTIGMDLPILYFKWSQIKFLKFSYISVPDVVCILANSADPDEMPPYAAFHLGS